MKRRGGDAMEPLVEHSFLRGVDPRTKIALALLASFAIMLPPAPLGVFAAAHVGFLLSARIAAPAWRQAWRLRWLLAILFVLDWLFVGPSLAILVTVRLLLLVTAFQIVVATTRPDELRRALERLGLPERVAFSLSIAQRSLADLERDGRQILEAQRTRGIVFAVEGESVARRLQRWWKQSLGMVVPVIVMATQRAWAAHEAAAVRGFGSMPAARDPMPLRRVDYGLLVVASMGFLGLALWR